MISAPTSTADAHRKLFIGGLSYNTDDEKLRNYFSAYGSVQDAVVMKDPISRRSRGFGFITFHDVQSVDNTLAHEPHTIDSRTVEAKRAVPRSEVPRESSKDTTKSAPSAAAGPTSTTSSASAPTASQSSTSSTPVTSSTGNNTSQKPQSKPHTFNSSAPRTFRKASSDDTLNACKVFVGGLHYDTRDGEFRSYFEKYGKVKSAEVMFNKETNKSRGFGFIIFEQESVAEQVVGMSEHMIDSKTVEVKWAVPRDKMAPGTTVAATPSTSSAAVASSSSVPLAPNPASRPVQKVDQPTAETSATIKAAPPSVSKTNTTNIKPTAAQPAQTKAPTVTTATTSKAKTPPTSYAAALRAGATNEVEESVSTPTDSFVENYNVKKGVIGGGLSQQGNSAPGSSLGSFPNSGSSGDNMLPHQTQSLLGELRDGKQILSVPSTEPILSSMSGLSLDAFMQPSSTLRDDSDKMSVPRSFSLDLFSSSKPSSSSSGGDGVWAAGARGGWAIIDQHQKLSPLTESSDAKGTSSTLGGLHWLSSSSSSSSASSNSSSSTSSNSDSSLPGSSSSSLPLDMSMGNNISRTNSLDSQAQGQTTFLAAGAANHPTPPTAYGYSEQGAASLYQSIDQSQQHHHNSEQQYAPNKRGNLQQNQQQPQAQPNQQPPAPQHIHAQQQYHHQQQQQQQQHGYQPQMQMQPQQHRGPVPQQPTYPYILPQAQQAMHTDGWGGYVGREEYPSMDYFGGFAHPQQYMGNQYGGQQGQWQQSQPQHQQPYMHSYNAQANAPYGMYPPQGHMPMHWDERGAHDQYPYHAHDVQDNSSHAHRMNDGYQQRGSGGPSYSHPQGMGNRSHQPQQHHQHQPQSHHPHQQGWGPA